MPLLVVCGVPRAGKTTRTNEVARFLQSAGKELTIVSLEAVGIVDVNEAHRSLEAEKQTRAALRADIDRRLSARHIVICDYINDIKGWRYELFCVARALRTPCCILFCDPSPLSAPADDDEDDGPGEMAAADGAEAADRGTRAALKRKKKDPGTEADSGCSTGPWEPAILRALTERMEAPSERNRWEHPLFVCHRGDETPCDAIMHALCASSSASPASASSWKPGADATPASTRATAQVPRRDPNFTFRLHQTLQDILEAILTARREGVVDIIDVPHASKRVRFPQRTVSPSILARLRAQFERILQLQNICDLDLVGDAFVDFLHAQLGSS